MQLYFLRHGKAVEPGGPDACDDASRALTPDGITEIEAEAEVLDRLGVRPDVIWTSPLLRARQTAEIVARRLGLEKRLMETELLAPGCDLDRLRKLLERQGTVERVMLVGHEPDFSSMVGDLISARGVAMELKKGGLAVVQLDGSVRAGKGVLRWLVPPKLLVRCASSDAAGDDAD